MHPIIWQSLKQNLATSASTGTIFLPVAVHGKTGLQNQDSLPKQPPMFHRFSHFLVMLLLVVSAMAPSGFMPHFGPDGFSIDICSGSTDKKQVIDPDHPDYESLLLIHNLQNPQDDFSENEDKAFQISADCTFAATSMDSLSSDNVDISRLIAQDRERRGPAARETQKSAHGLRPPATGPPASFG